MQELIFIGAVACPEIFEVVRDMNGVQPTFEPKGILDDDTKLRGDAVEGIPVLGPLSRASDFPDAAFVFGIGGPHTRLRRFDILGRLGLAPERFATLIHPGAKVYGSASVGAGTIIHCGTVIGNGTRIGNWVSIHWNTVIAADNQIGDGAMFASHVTTAKGVGVGAYAYVETGAVIAENVNVGPGALIGFASVIMRDVSSGARVLGNPPRLLARDDVPEGLLSG